MLLYEFVYHYLGSLCMMLYKFVLIISDLNVWCFIHIHHFLGSLYMVFYTVVHHNLRSLWYSTLFIRLSLSRIFLYSAMHLLPSLSRVLCIWWSEMSVFALLSANIAVKIIGLVLVINEFIWILCLHYLQIMQLVVFSTTSPSNSRICHIMLLGMIWSKSSPPLVSYFVSLVIWHIWYI